MSRPLSPRQQQALDVIRRRQRPSIREIATTLGVAYNAARQRVQLLERHGAITRTRGKWRSIVVVSA